MMFATRHDLGRCPKLVHRRSLQAATFPESLQCYIHADLVAKLEAIGHCLCRCVDLEASTANWIFLHAKVNGGPDMRTNRIAGAVDSRGPCLNINCHPDLVRRLGRELMELERGQEANYALRNFIGCFEERSVFRDRR